MPRHVGLLHRANLLDAPAHLPSRGRRPQGSLRRRLQGHLRQQRQQPSLQGGAAPPGTRKPGPQTSVAPRFGLFREVAQFLHVQREDGDGGDGGAGVQQLLPGLGRLRAALLRPGVPHSHPARHRALQLHLPLVLPRQLPQLHQHAGAARVPVRLRVWGGGLCDPRGGGGLRGAPGGGGCGGKGPPCGVVGALNKAVTRGGEGGSLLFSP